MRISFPLKKVAATLAVAFLTLITPAHAAPAVSPEEAVKQFVDGLRTMDKKVIASVVGPQANKWFFSGDEVADRSDWQKFLAAYDRKHGIAMMADGRAMLLVGEDDWPFPAPLVKNGNSWGFDAVKGKDELTNRRIGRNELDAIQTLLAIVDAQREYAAGDLDGNGFNDYAQRLLSSAGERDGLYWESSPGERISPLGPLVGKAASEGYSKKAGAGRPAPYHGYYYRLLKAQGKQAQGGEFDYMVRGKMLGGFAVLAYPAKYGVSGVMSFIVNHEGQVFQKNLGQATSQTAQKLSRFDPDASWQKAKP